MTLSPERVYQTWDILQRASVAFLHLLEATQVPLPGEQHVAHAQRLEAIHDQVVRVSNDIHVQLYHLGTERRRGDRRQS